MKKMMFLSIVLLFGFLPLQSSSDDGAVFNVLFFGALSFVTINYLKTTVIQNRNIQPQNTNVSSSPSKALILYQVQESAITSNLQGSTNQNTISPISVVVDQSPMVSNKHSSVKNLSEEAIALPASCPSSKSLSRPSSASSLVKPCQKSEDYVFIDYFGSDTK